MTGISVLILTKDEERDLPGCLESIACADDIWVLDSESSDRTVEIAQRFGARTVIRRFDGFSSQRNYALKNFPFKYPWLLILDADERPTVELIEEIRIFTRDAPDSLGAARLRRRDYFMGHWLKHAQISPFFVRLVRPSRVAYEREINEVLVVDGNIHEMATPLNHFPFSKGVDHWISKHNTYSSMEAGELIRRSETKPSVIKAIWALDFNVRRFHQKALFYRLPGRPLIKFFYMLVIRRAFLDGFPGWHYTLLQCLYEYLISLKAIERIEMEKLENLRGS
jgi:glycosyltransferase involved in cell wall biosynthesis